MAKPNPGKVRPNNSQYFCYQIEENLLDLIRTYGTKDWNYNLNLYLKAAETMKNMRAKERDMLRVPLSLPDGRDI
jgi:adenine-specific DNA-methyltransferase